MAISILNAGPSTVVAEPTDLPYALVEPGVWSFSGSGVQSGHTYTVELSAGYDYEATLKDNGVQVSEVHQDEEFGTIIDFSAGTPSVNITATRASLPGQLLDRACNLISVSAPTTLTLPAAISGHARDFLVRLEFGTVVGTLPSVTFSSPSGESITYETDGDSFPAPDSDGNWLYSFTETAASTFAVSLKSVTTVTQGGGT